MHRKTRILTLLLTLALALTTFGSVAANDEPGPCPGDSVLGRVVAVDPATGKVTLDPGDLGGELCWVSVDGDAYPHPVVDMLGKYFAKIDLEELIQALDDLQVEVTCDNGDCTISEETSAVIISFEGEEGGTFTFKIKVGDQEKTLTTDDEELAEGLIAALDTLQVEWTLVDEEGTPRVSDVGDDIGDYHSEGIGFGLLVKFFAWSTQTCDAGETVEPCQEVSFEDLVAQHQEGWGIGKLFKLFGKPALLGVGHVRKALDTDNGNGLGKFNKPDKADKVHGVCKARSDGGKAKAKGKPDLECSAP